MGYAVHCGGWFNRSAVAGVSRTRSVGADLGATVMACGKPCQRSRLWSEGSLTHAYIVIGAHCDGQGLPFPPVNGDFILNSANDNAPGAARGRQAGAWRAANERVLQIT